MHIIKVYVNVNAISAVLSYSILKTLSVFVIEYRKSF